MELALDLSGRPGGRRPTGHISVLRPIYRDISGDIEARTPDVAGVDQCRVNHRLQRGRRLRLSPALLVPDVLDYFVASDVSAILHHTRDVFFLMDGDVAVLTPEGVRLTDFDGRPVNRQVQHILWDPIMAEKGGYKHFMLKEIFEQPRAVRDTIIGRVSRETGRVYLDEMDITPDEFARFQQAKIVACGTSWHAALAGKFMLEKLARLPVEVDYGSEFRYRDPSFPRTPSPS
jgi:glucosamine 6-phosphate synthetase-like amidotransferase/phosphosugar isomerase protein